MLIYLLLKITRGGLCANSHIKHGYGREFSWLYRWVAYAAGLGKLTVLSTLGQPLSAEVDLVSVQKDELSTLVARIASPDAFQQANMQYSPALIGVRMTIERRSDGKPYIRIVSTRSINDPFLAILIELTWGSGAPVARVHRTYRSARLCADAVTGHPAGRRRYADHAAGRA